MSGCLWKGADEQLVIISPFVDVSHLEHYHLMTHGVHVAKKILCIIEHERPDITYSPTLFALTCLLLHYLDEQSSYDCISELVTNKEKLYVTQTKVAYEARPLILKELARKHAVTFSIIVVFIIVQTTFKNIFIQCIFFIMML